MFYFSYVTVSILNRQNPWAKPQKHPQKHQKYAHTLTCLQPNHLQRNHKNPCPYLCPCLLPMLTPILLPITNYLIIRYLQNGHNYLRPCSAHPRFRDMGTTTLRVVHMELRRIVILSNHIPHTNSHICDRSPPRNWESHSLNPIADPPGGLGVWGRSREKECFLSYERLPRAGEVNPNLGLPGCPATRWGSGVAWLTPVPACVPGVKTSSAVEHGRDCVFAQ